jgi:hypothetical protein
LTGDRIQLQQVVLNLLRTHRTRSSPWAKDSVTRRSRPIARTMAACA